MTTSTNQPSGGQQAGSNVPLPPIFGGTNTVGNWCGGPFNETFDGVTSLGPANPFCHRFTDYDRASKQYEKRTKGIEEKFKKDDPNSSLRSFASEVSRHVKKHGLDTGFYMYDPSDASQVNSILTHHSQYTTDTVIKFWNSKYSQLDQTMRDALDESGEYLLNCIDKSLRNSIELGLGNEKPIGPFVWMHLVNACQSDSIRRSTIIAKKFEGLSLAGFPGENVEDYARSAQEYLTELERSGNLPIDHLPKIIDHLTKASNEEFRITFMGKRSKLETFIRSTAGKSQVAARQDPNYTHFNELLNEAKSLYTTLNESEAWGMSGSKKSHEAMIADLKSQVKTLTNKMAEVRKKQPKNQENNEDQGSKSKTKLKFRKGRDGFDVVQADTLAPRWKFIPPGNGHAHKRVVNGEKWYWCSNRCNRWNSTHTTDEHVSRNSRDRNNNNNTNNNNNRGNRPEANTASLTPRHNAWFDENDE